MSISKFVTFAFFLFLSLLPTCFADTPDLKLHQKCLYPTVKVSLEDYDSGGTGVIVRSTKVGSEWHNVFLTAGHVVRLGNFNVHVYEYKDHSTIKSHIILPCSFYTYDIRRDLAIGVFVSAREMPTAEIGFDTKLYVGNDVMRVGCGLGDEPRLDVGKISSVKTVITWHKDAIRTTIYTLPGDSGSAVFNDYKVVGIMIMIRSRETSAGHQVMPGMSYAVPVRNIQSWSEENNNAFSFAWNRKDRIPMLPIYQIKLMRDLEIIDNE